MNQNKEARVTVTERKNSISMILDPIRAKNTALEMKEKKTKNVDACIDTI